MLFDTLLMNNIIIIIACIVIVIMNTIVIVIVILILIVILMIIFTVQNIWNTFCFQLKDTTQKNNTNNKQEIIAAENIENLQLLSKKKKKWKWQTWKKIKFCPCKEKLPELVQQSRSFLMLWFFLKALFFFASCFSLFVFLFYFVAEDMF